jgi:hypothetical protein
MQAASHTFDIKVQRGYETCPEWYQDSARALAHSFDKMTWSTGAKNEIIINGRSITLGYSGGHEYWIKMFGAKHTTLCAVCEELAEEVMQYYCEHAFAHN